MYGIEVMKNDPTIPFLMFVDYYMIFCKATRSAAWMLILF